MYEYINILCSSRLTLTQPCMVSVKVSFDEAKPQATRMTFHPLHELPKLRHWFQTLTDPSDAQLAQFTNELNSAPVRRTERNKLTANQLKNWWKNEKQRSKRQCDVTTLPAREKSRRLRKCSSVALDTCSGDGGNASAERDCDRIAQQQNHQISSPPLPLRSDPMMTSVCKRSPEKWQSDGTAVDSTYSTRCVSSRSGKSSPSKHARRQNKTELSSNDGSESVSQYFSNQSANSQLRLGSAATAGARESQQNSSAEAAGARESQQSSSAKAAGARESQQSSSVKAAGALESRQSSSAAVTGALQRTMSPATITSVATRHPPFVVAAMSAPLSQTSAQILLPLPGNSTGFAVPLNLASNSVLLNPQLTSVTSPTQQVLVVLDSAHSERTAADDS